MSEQEKALIDAVRATIIEAKAGGNAKSDIILTISGMIRGAAIIAPIGDECRKKCAKMAMNAIGVIANK